MEWTPEKERLLKSWTNQIGLNRRAHFDARIRCRNYFYSLKIPFSFLIAVNLLLATLEVLGFKGTSKIIFIVISALVAMLILFLDLVISILGWSEAGEAHAATVRDLDTLRFEIQREYYTEVDKRRKWEPLMVFITEKLNQINSTKSTALLRKNFDDSVIDVMESDYTHGTHMHGDMADQIQDLLEEVRPSIERKNSPKESLWKVAIDKLRRKNKTTPSNSSQDTHSDKYENSIDSMELGKNEARDDELV